MTVEKLALDHNLVLKMFKENSLFKLNNNCLIKGILKLNPT